ncbi:RNA-binding protein 34 [Aethina tumida]|uniref:RNA-binding protein 34 n=1 Tax=Aethina tumida TaxID=116153 RepID=UPI00096AE8C7|nr:RNA-binding protein 34 [Aethina tumida]
MDYSVGSLSDLITGKNTPNKPKVIQKAYTPSKSDPVVDEPKSEDSPKKRRLSATANTNDRKISPKKNGMNSVRNSVSNEIKESQQIPIKIKKEKEATEKPEKVTSKSKQKRENQQSPIKIKNENEATEMPEKMTPKSKQKKENEESEVPEKVTPKLKQKKFKQKLVSTNSNDIVENQDESQVTTEKINLKRKAETEDQSPKKKKLSKNEANAAKRVLYKERELIKDNPEDLAKTIFIGNIPLAKTLDLTKKQIKQHFRQYGIISTIRLRGISVADPKTSKKIAAIKSEINPKRKTVNGYIKFAKEEDAKKAVEQNGKLFNDHHLRVHLLDSSEKPDETKAIFIGNLSFEAEEDDLWKIFEPCGPIDSIRIVRDRKTGMGRGFAYVNFVNSDSVQLSLEMENVQLNNRELRISLCNLSMAKKNKNKNKVAKINKPGKPKLKNKFRKFRKVEGDGENPNRQGFENKQFQGSKFNDKGKKKKFNKGDLQKKKLIKKIAPKPRE